MSIEDIHKSNLEFIKKYNVKHGSELIIGQKLFRDEYCNVKYIVTSIHPLYGWICCKSELYKQGSQINIRDILRVDGVDVEK